MFQPTFVPVTAGFRCDLHERLRQSDLQELEASTGGREPEDILAEAVDISHMAWAGYRCNSVQLLYGVADVYGDQSYGSIWLLGSDDIESFPVAFMKQTRWVIAVVSSIYPVIGNLVDDRNKQSQAWLESLGFKAESQETMHGQPFTLYNYYRS